MRDGASSYYLRKLRVGCFLHGKRERQDGVWDGFFGGGLMWSGILKILKILLILIQTRGDSVGKEVKMER